MNTQKPFAPAAERNKQAILLAMQKVLCAGDTVFEFGSGTGQHACHIASTLRELNWQPSDIEDKLPGIRQWIAESGCQNILPPVKLDLNDSIVPECKASICFSANTLHIVSWPLVKELFRLSAAILKDKGKLCIYGPFVFNGHYTSDSNRQFNQQLRDSDPDSGIRDVHQLEVLAGEHGFSKVSVTDMPANNHLLIWNRDMSG